ncbi:MAG: helix-turn-helix domain-containing protein [Clostridia bacterium]|nr:helix-turn-helix domain-containing protein [Clostridia bacterium]
MDLTEKAFSKNLKDIRTAKGYSQQAVADKLGIAVSTYANWEQGRTQPSISDIIRLIAAFEIDANELFDISE